MNDKTDQASLQFGSLDRLIHDPTRLMLMSILFVVESADFVYLKNRTNLTAGNISSHMTKLENARYINVKKSFVGKRPQTMFRLSKKGRSAFESYRASLDEALSSLPKPGQNS